MVRLFRHHTEISCTQINKSYIPSKILLGVNGVVLSNTSAFHKYVYQFIIIIPINTQHYTIKTKYLKIALKIHLNHF